MTSYSMQHTCIASRLFMPSMMLMKFRPREPEACFGRSSAISNCPFHFWSASLIFTCIESFNLVFKQWDFNALQIGLCFVSVVVGYLVALCDVSSRYCTAGHIRQRDGNAAHFPERRLLLLLFIAPLEAIGLFGFAWASMGPGNMH